MSEKLNYPPDATESLPSILNSVRGILALLRQVFFPKSGSGLVERVVVLEEKIAFTADSLDTIEGGAGAPGPPGPAGPTGPTGPAGAPGVTDVYDRATSDSRFINAAGDTMSGALHSSHTGIAAAPSFTVGAVNNGMYHAGSNILGFSTVGVVRLSIGSTAIQSIGVPIRSIDGTNIAPGFAFTSGTGDGMWRVSTGIIAFSTSAAERFRVSTTALTTLVPLAVGGAIDATGNVTVTKAGPALALDAVGLTSAQIYWKKDTLNLWQQFTSGADMNLFLFRYDNAGPPVATTALQINRLTGEFGFNGAVVVGTPFTFHGDTMRLTTARTPASATAAGTIGMICWDSGFIYVCTAANTWKRAALATW